MSKIICYLLIILLSPTSSFAVTSPTCGPSALMEIAEMFGVKTTIEEINRLSGFDPKNGTTMLGLLSASMKLDLPAVAVKLTMEQLCNIKAPVIAWTDGNHFTVIHSCKMGEKLVIQDPPAEKQTVSKDEFAKRWQGESLVYSKNLKKKMANKIITKMKSPEGPRIHFSETAHFFGSVNEGDKLTHTFRFSNIGTGTLDVYSRSTCSCTAALLSSKTISPGGSGEIKLEYDTRGRSGQTSQSIQVRTNDPENEWITLTVATTVKTSVKVVPERLWLDEIVMGEKVLREVLVFNPSDSALKVVNVKTPEKIRAKILPAREDNNFRSVPVQLVINGANNLGNFEKTVIIQTNDKNRPEIPVTISGIVIGEAKAFPPVLFFNEVKPESEAFREIVIMPVKERKIDITRIAVESPYIVTEILPGENVSQVRLRATVKSPPMTSSIRDTLRVYVNGRGYPELIIPLFAHVQ